LVGSKNPKEKPHLLVDSQRRVLLCRCRAMPLLQRTTAAALADADCNTIAALTASPHAYQDLLPEKFLENVNTNLWLKGPNPDLQVETIGMPFQKTKITPRSQLLASTKNRKSITEVYVCFYSGFRMPCSSDLQTQLTVNQFFHSARRVKVQWSSLFTGNRIWIRK